MTKNIPIDLLNDPGGSSFYTSERKIYPRDVSGRFQNMRKIAVFILLGMYYVFPWLQWDGRQAVLFDLPARKFYIFSLTFWPQDFVFLALLLIIAGIALFFFTTVSGRLWCGYACPQTVWTEAFLWMERWLEGDRSRRIKLDAAPWTANKILRKSGKHLLWLSFAVWTGFTFVGFFTPISNLALRLIPFQWGGWETFWVLFYALATWGNAGFLREQVCKYMCPYARFQSAMFDRNTLIIAYDFIRGEPRGAHKNKSKNKNTGTHTELSTQSLQKVTSEIQGDCIDCTICVQVCPTGIDIRNGLQYECIACGACIDACDQVMEKIGSPKGLIRYSTQNTIDGKPNHIIRPRVVIYGILLLTLCIAWIWGVGHRSALIAEVLRDRNALYRMVNNNKIENGYTLKIINKDSAPHHYKIRIKGSDDIEFVGANPTINANAESVLTIPLTLTAPNSLRGKQNIQFEVQTIDGNATQTIESSFFGPTK